jgi:hypothetical protein
MFELAELFVVLETVAKGNDMLVAQFVDKAKDGRMTSQDLKELYDTVLEMRHEPYHWTVYLLLELIDRKTHMSGKTGKCKVVHCECEYADGSGNCHLKGRECPELDRFDNKL